MMNIFRFHSCGNHNLVATTMVSWLLQTYCAIHSRYVRGWEYKTPLMSPCIYNKQFKGIWTEPIVKVTKKSFSFLFLPKPILFLAKCCKIKKPSFRKKTFWSSLDNTNKKYLTICFLSFYILDKLHRFETATHMT